MGDFQKLQYELRDMEQELKIRTEQNAELYAKLCNALTQLEEANDVIISVAFMPRFPVNPELCREYLEKWGVK